MWLGVIILLWTTAMPLGVAGWIMHIWEGDPDGILVLILFSSVIAFFLYYSHRKHNQRSLLSRKLAANPDLLGQAQGYGSSEGLWFFDGRHQHWFSPNFLSRAKVTPAGLCVPLDTDPYRYLPLSHRIFESYSPEVAKRLLQGWQKSELADLPAEMNQRLGEPPEDAIHFRCAGPLAAVPNRATRLSERIVTVIQFLLLCLALANWNVFSRGVVIGIVIAWLIALFLALPAFNGYRNRARYDVGANSSWLAVTRRVREL